MKWGDLKPSTLADMIQSCVQNAQGAARDEAEARRRVERYQPGDAALAQAQHDVVRFRADQRWWREYADHYRQRAKREGADTLVPLPPGMQRVFDRVRPAPVEQHQDPRLPREPGDDNEDTLPF